jgi:hypothetical protein
MSEQSISPAFMAEIRAKIAAKIPVWAESAQRGDDHSLRLLCRFRPDIEKELERLAGEGDTEASALLARLERARVARAELLGHGAATL